VGKSNNEPRKLPGLVVVHGSRGLALLACAMPKVISCDDDGS
jgi:hypothetical protein